MRFTDRDLQVASFELKSTSTPEMLCSLTANLKQNLEQILITHSLIKLKAHVETRARSADCQRKKTTYRPRIPINLELGCNANAGAIKLGVTFELSGECINYVIEVLSSSNVISVSSDSLLRLCRLRRRVGNVDNDDDSLRRNQWWWSYIIARALTRPHVFGTKKEIQIETNWELADCDLRYMVRNSVVRIQRGKLYGPL